MPSEKPESRKGLIKDSKIHAILPSFVVEDKLDKEKKKIEFTPPRSRHIPNKEL